MHATRPRNGVQERPGQGQRTRPACERPMTSLSCPPPSTHPTTTATHISSYPHRQKHQRHLQTPSPAATATATNTTGTRATYYALPNTLPFLTTTAIMQVPGTVRLLPPPPPPPPPLMDDWLTPLRGRIEHRRSPALAHNLDAPPLHHVLDPSPHLHHRLRNRIRALHPVDRDGISALSQHPSGGGLPPHRRAGRPMPWQGDPYCDCW